MAFICPGCSRPDLEIKESLELGSDASSDERSLQLVACRACSFSGAALYEESRRGSFGSEHIRHNGIKADPDTLLKMKKLVIEKDITGADEFLSQLKGKFTSFDMELVRDQ